MKSRGKTSAKKIRRLRDAFGMTQEEMAQILGVSVTTISRWEQGAPPRKRKQAALDTLAAFLHKPKEERDKLRKRLLVGVALGLSSASILPLGVRALTGILGTTVKGLFGAIFDEEEKDEKTAQDQSKKEKV